MDPFTFNFAIAVLIMIAFLAVGIVRFHEIKTYRDLFLGGKQIGSNDFQISTVAATTSAATVLFWFLTSSKNEGLFLLWAPVSVALGTIVLYWGARSNRFDFGNINSLPGLLIELFPQNPWLRIAIGAISGIAILALLTIEMFIGVQIFSVYSNGTPEAELYGLMFVGGIAAAYAILGGLPGVVRNDKIQMLLMYLFAISGIVILGSVVLSSDTAMSSVLTASFPHPIFDANNFIIWIPLFFI